MFFTDWLSVFVNVGALDINNREYEFIRQEQGSMSFRHIDKILYHGREVAVLQSSPYSKFIDKNCGIVKFSNEVLYLRGAFIMCCHILSSNNIKFLSISRWDVCCDSVLWADGSPRDRFIKKYLNGEIIRMGKGKVFGRGSHYWEIKGIYQLKENLFVFKNSFEFAGYHENGLELNYLAFGSRSSDVRAYIYNKSLELREVKGKEYIKDCWRENGWDNVTDVWRVEFSVKGNRMEMISRETGEYFAKTMYSATNYETIKTYFLALASRYFDIRKNTGQKRKDREERLNLFGNDSVEVHPSRVSSGKDNVRTDKTFLKKLYTSPSDLYYDNIDFELNTIRAGREYAITKGLWQWCVKNGIDFSEERERRVLSKQRELDFNNN